MGPQQTRAAAGAESQGREGATTDQLGVGRVEADVVEGGGGDGRDPPGGGLGAVAPVAGVDRLEVARLAQLREGGRGPGAGGSATEGEQQKRGRGRGGEGGKGGGWRNGSPTRATRLGSVRI